MRVYHFISEEYGLESVRLRRLKISMFNDLNDPFELLGITLSDKKLRRAMTQTKNQISQTYGLQCFSTKWTNPVLWSHYADKHRGL